MNQNKTTSLTLMLLLLCVSPILAGEVILALPGIASETNTKFGYYAASKESDPISTLEWREGRFWTEWRIETNDAPVMVGFDSFPNIKSWSWESSGATNGVFMTNAIYLVYCNKEHIDRSEQTVTKYVSSNLLSFLVWRGKTNMHYLESIPITNYVHHWHWDKVQVWKD